MRIQEQLEIIRITRGTNILLPTPPACAVLMQRAQAEGIFVGQLFVLSCSLLPGIKGSYDRTSGDMWCHYYADDPEGNHTVLRCLLTLLAHAKLRQPVPETIEQDWQQEQMAWEAAIAMARVWDMEDLFPESVLSAREREAERLLTFHQAAGELAGNLDPFVARAAYHALADIRLERDWSDEQFEAALYGYSEHDEDNAAVLAFDRTLLRFSWSIPYRSQREGPPFGDWTLPQPVCAQNVLRSVLERATRIRTHRTPLRSIEREWFETPLHLHFLRVESDLDLTRVIDTANAWLIEEGRGLAAEGMWWLYASSSSERVYRLTVHYKPSLDDARLAGGLPPARELWALFRTGEHMRTVEAAYQRYILSWLRMQELRCEQLIEGLQLLWAYL